MWDKGSDFLPNSFQICRELMTSCEIPAPGLNPVVGCMNQQLCLLTAVGCSLLDRRSFVSHSLEMAFWQSGSFMIYGALIRLKVVPNTSALLINWQLAGMCSEICYREEVIWSHVSVRNQSAQRSHTSLLTLRCQLVTLTGLLCRLRNTASMEKLLHIYSQSAGPSYGDRFVPIIGFLSVNYFRV